MYFINKILLFTIAYLGSSILPFNPSFPYADIYLLPSKLPQWLWSFANFDGVHYLTIAQKGYSAQFTQVYFPLYPILLKYFSVIFPLNQVLTGLIISNLFFLSSLFVFYLLIKDGDLSFNRFSTI